MKKTTVIIGAGKFGCQIAQNLARDGENVTILDIDKDAFDKLDDYSGFTKVGDGTNVATLKELGLEEAKMLVIVTPNDNANLFIADAAHLLYDVPDIYVRLSSKNKVKLITSGNIHPICPFLLSISYFNSLREKGDAI